MRLFAIVAFLLAIVQDGAWKPTSRATGALAELKAKFKDQNGFRFEAFGYIAHAAKADDRRFERTNRFLQTYAKFAMKELFDKPPGLLRVISFSDAEDFYKFAGRRGISGYYSNGQLVNNLNDGLGTCAHEMTHALNDADWGGFANGWFTEGVGALMENCLRKSDGTFVGIAYSHWRFPGVRRRIEGGSIQGLRAHMEQRNSDANSYAQGRWVLTYLFYKRKLREFIKRFRDTRRQDRSGITALEAVTGQTLGEFEKSWKEWSKGLEVEIASIRMSKLHPVLGIVGRNKPGGLEVAAVTPLSTAETAGLKEGDTLTRADGRVVKSMAELLKVLSDKKDGEKIKLEYSRDGIEYSKTVILDQYIDG